MSPIVGEIAYREMTRDDIARYMREAEVLRAEAVRDMVVDIFRAVGHVGKVCVRAVRAVIANPAIHPTAGAR